MSAQKMAVFFSVLMGCQDRPAVKAALGNMDEIGKRNRLALLGVALAGTSTRVLEQIMDPEATNEAKTHGVVTLRLLARAYHLLDAEVNDRPYPQMQPLAHAQQEELVAIPAMMAAERAQGHLQMIEEQRRVMAEPDAEQAQAEVEP